MVSEYKHRGRSQALWLSFPWVLWESYVTSNQSQYMLYNVTTGQNITVPEPPGATLVGNDNSDFATIDGNLTLFFWAEFPNASPQNITTNVFS